MEHTNEILKKILRDEFADYDYNGWHYDREYKLLEKAFIKGGERKNNIVKEGDLYKYLKDYTTGKRKPDLTIGKTYTIEKVKLNYRCYKIMVAILDDKNILRWYSFVSPRKRWQKVN